MPGRDRDAATDRLRTFERLIADVAHDLRTPIQAQLMNVEVARMGKSAPTTRRALDALEEESLRLSALVNALTSVLQSQSGAAETFEIDLAMLRLMPLLRAGTRTRFTVAEYDGAGDGMLVHAPLDTVCYAVARAVLALRDALSDGAVLSISAHAQPQHVDLRVSGAPRTGGRVRPEFLTAALEALAPAIDAAGGTIAIRAGSTPGQTMGVRLTIARAGHRLTGVSAAG